MINKNVVCASCNRIINVSVDANKGQVQVVTTKCPHCKANLSIEVVVVFAPVEIMKDDIK